MVERRLHPRQSFYRSGVIYWGTTAIGCRVRDLSNTGIGVLLLPEVTLPEHFNLWIQESVFSVRRVWRREEFLGLERICLRNTHLP